MFEIVVSAVEKESGRVGRAVGSDAVGRALVRRSLPDGRTIPAVGGASVDSRQITCGVLTWGQELVRKEVRSGLLVL